MTKGLGLALIERGIGYGRVDLEGGVEGLQAFCVASKRKLHFPFAALSRGIG